MAGIGLFNPLLLWGLAAVAIPLLLHLRRRRPNEVVDWGAAMFLDEPSEFSKRRTLPLDERLLLVVRVGLLALLAVALARPFWAREGERDSPSRLVAAVPQRGRTFVLVVDRSASMEHRGGGGVPRSLALRWARRFVSALGPDDAAALVVAGARSLPKIEPPTRDKTALLNAIMELEPRDGKVTGGGPSDLAAALDDALRLVADAPASASDVLVLTDGQRFPWRPDESLRWKLARERHRQIRADAPRIWGITFGSSERAPMAVPGTLTVTPTPALTGRPFHVSTTVSNTGADPITVQGRLLVDGRPIEPPVAAGPIAPKGRAPLVFSTTIAAPGGHLLSVELDDSDAIPGDNAAEGFVEVIDQIPVLLVDGKPGSEPLGGQADFLRIALDPRDASTTDGRGSTFHTRVVSASRFTAKDLDGEEGRPRVVVLADVAELSAESAGAINRFVAAGGGVLVLAGDAARSSFYASQEWFPGRLSEGIVTAATGLDLSSFSGATLGRFASTGSVAGPLAQVEVFRHRGLEPAPKAIVSAKLGSGTPWCVERPFGQGRVLVVPTALDARATTLPINPEFVPLAHEWILGLSRGSSVVKSLAPGEPWVVALDPVPPVEVKTIPLRVPGGAIVEVPVTREGSGALASASVRVDDTDAPGVYRLGRERPSYAVVDRDPRESDPATLSDGDCERLSAGWPLTFAAGDPALVDAIRASTSSGQGDDRISGVEFWRILVLLTLAGLCVESWLTRRLG